MKNDKNIYTNSNNVNNSTNNNKFSKKHNVASFEKNRNLIKKIKTKKSKKYKRIMLIVKIASLAVILFVIFITFSVFSKFNQKLNLSDIGLTESDEIAEKQISDITNILLLGIDENNVSDAMMIASIDKQHQKINLISIARDSLVKIEPKNQKAYHSKINEAYSHGGEETTLKTINKNFGLRLMDYITVNFEGLGDIIDALGGLDLEISKKESNQIDGIINSTKILKKKNSKMLHGQFGNVHLSGSQAVTYARIRKVETLNGLHDDFGRAYRQRLVMELVFNKAMNFDKSKIFGLIKAFLPNMKTSLNLKTIFNIYKCIKGKHYKISKTQVPTPPYTIDPDYKYNSKSTVFYDVTYAGKLINDIIYNNSDQETYLEEHPPKINHTTSKSNLTPTKSTNVNKTTTHNSNFNSQTTTKNEKNRLDNQKFNQSNSNNLNNASSNTDNSFKKFNSNTQNSYDKSTNTNNNNFNKNLITSNNSDSSNKTNLKGNSNNNSSSNKTNISNISNTNNSSAPIINKKIFKSLNNAPNVSNQAKPN